jgi:copper transport protein
MRLTWLRAGSISIVAALVMLASMSAVYAHAQLLASDPSQDAILDTSPETVQLTFNEPVTALRIELIGGDGETTDLLAATESGAAVIVHLPGQLPTGSSVLSWRIASADGHPVAGSLIFSIGHVTGAAGPVATTDRLTVLSLWTTKAILFITLFVGVGCAAFGAAVPLPAEARRTSAIAAFVGFLIAPLTLALQGIDALGLPLVAVFSEQAWLGGFATSYGATAICAAIALALAGLSLTVGRGSPSRWLVVFAYVAGALSLSLSGHASAAEPQWLTRPAVFLHLAGILAWIGALLPLWMLLGERSEAANRALATFSRYSPSAVGPLVFSGLTLAAIQLGWPGPQWVTPYTAILAGKVMLLIMLFGLAVWNRFKLTEPALAGEAGAWHRLRQSIRAEAVIVLLIVGLVAGWRFTPPPRALAAVEAAAPSEPIFIHMMDADIMAMVTITPGAPGPVAIELEVFDVEGDPIEPEAVTVALGAPERGIEPFKRAATQTDVGWEVEDVVIPVAGNWTVAVELRVSRFSLVTLQEAVEIPQ